MALKSINPTTGELIHNHQPDNSAQIESKLNAAQKAFSEWRRSSLEQRCSLLRQCAVALEQQKASLAQLMTLEMGKPITQSTAELDKCILLCHSMAEQGPGFLSEQQVSTNDKQAYVSFDPLGVVFTIMPWNFPFWQVFRVLVPALMAGNVIVLKHASNVMGCAHAMTQLMSEISDYPLLTNLVIGSDQVEPVIRHPVVQAVSLTGSTQAGQVVARLAGEQLKKCVLELGGSDPYLILADADLDLAVEKCVTSRLINSGQSCIAAKRFIIEASVQADFEARFVSAMQAQRVGDPLESATQVGPQARFDLRDSLHQQVKDSIEQGADCLLGGAPLERPGAYYPPTVLSQVTPGMTAFDDELFGPVAALITAENDEHAISLANQTVFGLGAAVFTTDRAKGQRIAQYELAAGNCVVNDLVQSDPKLPFGGIKHSGYGRELTQFGIWEFMNIKSIRIN